MRRLFGDRISLEALEINSALFFETEKLITKSSGLFSLFAQFLLRILSSTFIFPFFFWRATPAESSGFI